MLVILILVNLNTRHADVTIYKLVMCIYMSKLISTMPRMWKEVVKAIRIETITTFTTHQYVTLLKCLLILNIE